MRITHFVVGRCNPDGSNGVDKSVFHLATSQAGLGHDVSIFGLSAKPAIPIPGVDARTYPPSGPASRAVDLPSRRLWRDLREWRPDVVHIHSLYIPANAVVAQGLRRRGIPYVITPHGAASEYVMRRRPYLKWTYRALVERPTLNRAAFVHAIADQHAIRDYGVVSPLVIAPNGIDIGSVPEGLDRQACRAGTGLDSRSRVAVFLGRLDHVRKGLDLLIEALAEVTRRGPDLSVVLVGPDHGTSRRFLADLAERRGVSSRVVFWGPAFGAEKFRLLGAADFVVHPARSEAGVPASVLEAMAVGRPCLVSRPSDPDGVIADHDAGLVVEPTVPAIAQGLEQLARASPQTLAGQGERATLLAREEFSWPRTAEAVIEGYARYAANSRLG
jgi:glycosyltransferase involved in cell wall biosynthesis